MLKKLVATVFFTLFVASSVLAANFDHSAWDRLLKTHVKAVDNGHATTVDYQGLQIEHAELKKYLIALAAIKNEQFDGWSKENQLAFLINAYNAWTVDLILTQWPNLESIKDLGSFFRSPWSKKIAWFLGKQRSLDDIEHKLIRGSGRYEEPRIHFAVNCASTGCPALRAEAYIGERLDAQLEEQTQLFLGDKSRNRLEGDALQLSSIFKWYDDDFEKQRRGHNSLQGFLSEYADALLLSPAALERLKSKRLDIEFLDYNWQLNQLR